MNEQPRLRVAIVGNRDQTDGWASAFQGAAQICPSQEEPMSGIDAVVLAPGVSDPFGRAKDALKGGVAVLYAAPFLLSPWQAASLHELSRTQGALLRFTEPFQYRRGFTFLQRLLEGEEPFWRPLYLRTLCLVSDAGIRIDELATEELAMCEALVYSQPQRVSAVASRLDAMSQPSAVFITVEYSDGLVVQCTISLTETAATRQLVAVAHGRTITLDELDPVAPVRIAGGSPHDGRRQPIGSSWQDHAPSVGERNPRFQEAKRFLEAVSSDDGSLANGQRWSRVALLWWAARQSMSFGGPIEVPSRTLQARDAATPPFTVIRGGGKAASSSSRPGLTLVAR